MELSVWEENEIISGPRYIIYALSTIQSKKLLRYRRSRVNKSTDVRRGFDWEKGDDSLYCDMK